MIWDIQKDPYSREMAHARVVDADTGEVIPDLIFYADDEAGIYRRFIRDESGEPYAPEGRPYREFCFLVDHRQEKMYTVSPPPAGFTGEVWREYEPDEHGQEFAWEEVRRPIRIIPADPLPPASDPPPSWAARPWAAIRRTMTRRLPGG